MYKNNTVQAFCCFFYDKVIFCRRYNKAGGIIILLLFLSENIRSMKKILNNLLHRLKEDSLNKRVGNSRIIRHLPFCCNYIKDEDYLE